MKKYKAILFDLDATITNVEQDLYTNTYFKLLANAFKDMPGGPMPYVNGVIAGVEAMEANDNSKLNIDVFWETFNQVTGMNEDPYDNKFVEFYNGDFRKSQAVVVPNPLAKEAIAIAHEKADFVVLATNPVFPRAAQIIRAEWQDLKEEDFDIITDYETYGILKPKAGYYHEICKRLGVKPEECLMIGNDEREDMYGAVNAGMDAYLVTDHVIRREGYEWSGPGGTFSDMLNMLRAL